MKQTIYLIAVCLMFPAFALAAGAGEPDAAGLQAIQGGSRSVTYKGRVVDERSSVPLAGVAIVVKDAPQIGMTTNSEGEFRITIPVRYQPLVSVSYIGYQPRESVLVAAADNEIRLKEEAQALEEVQVIAYGQQKKVSVTGAIASINTKDLLKSPSGSAGSALAGAVTGDIRRYRFPDSPVPKTPTFMSAVRDRFRTRRRSRLSWWTVSSVRFSRWTRTRSRV